MDLAGLKFLQRYNILYGSIQYSLNALSTNTCRQSAPLLATTHVAHPLLWKTPYNAYVIALIPRSFGFTWEWEDK